KIPDQGTAGVKQYRIYRSLNDPDLAVEPQTIVTGAPTELDQIVPSGSNTLTFVSTLLTDGKDDATWHMAVVPEDQVGNTKDLDGKTRITTRAVELFDTTEPRIDTISVMPVTSTRCNASR